MLNTGSYATSSTDVNLYFDHIISYLKDNEETYKMLLASKEPLLFLEKISRLINEKLYATLIADFKVPKSNSLKFDISFFTDGIINQVLRYFTGRSDYSLDDICNYMKKYFKIIFMQNDN